MFLFTSFEEFKSELGDRPDERFSVDRKNNDGNYEKGNIKWSTKRQQMNNRRDADITRNVSPYRRVSPYSF